MNAISWSTALIAIAAAVAAVAAIPPCRHRKGFVSVCAVLLALALVLIVIPIGRASDPDRGNTNGDPKANSLFSPSPIVSVAPTTVPPSQSGESAAQGNVLGTPLLGDQAPDGTIVTQGGDVWVDTYVDDTTMSINGQKANNAMGATCRYCHVNSNVEGYVTLNLGRKYSKLQARFGVTDNSQSTAPATVEAIAIEGGKQVSTYKKSFTVGESDDAVLRVPNVLQLKFVFRGPLDHVYPAVGDPTAF